MLYGGFERKKSATIVAGLVSEDFPETQKLQFFKNHFVFQRNGDDQLGRFAAEDPIQEELTRVHESPGTNARGNRCRARASNDYVLEMLGCWTK